MCHAHACCLCVVLMGNAYHVYRLRARMCAHRHGGAIVNLVGTDLTAVDCTFVSNTAYSGGAVYTSSEQLPTITSSNFVNKTCVPTVAGDAPEGGALAIALNVTAAVNGSIFTGNTSPSGSGGAISSSGAVTLYDAVMTSNSAAQQGGAIIAHAGSVTLDSVLLVGNSAGLDGACSAL
jgi:predicted outer membrane repeat protein